MADLYRNADQVKFYASIRPTYPPELFDFVASKAPSRQLAWDAGTGSGQAAVSLSSLFDSVVATDSSPELISHAPTHLSNIRFVVTPPSLSLPDLHRLVAPPGSVDLITVATALHWFDIPAFFGLARSVLRPGGVLAAWCYDGFVNIDGGRVDEIYRGLMEATWPYVDEKVRAMVVEGYAGVEFPFEAVEGVEEGTAPVRRFAVERELGLEGLIALLKTGTGYQRAREAGVEVLTEEAADELKRAWFEDGEEVKKVKSPIKLRIGRMGSS
ncbi:putative methyltransferase DDB_G0268948 [Dendrobium catenatum]|uniref:Methyltransferase type 11 domain-containing protein n=1 Tax=Dendrobium catenatum TaxID=906689 RepID=A0A2I0XHN4_9ASPA|nr:putative methyltransferase DDB_G0268948 [Dendrobium catenatum]PKU87426.1 hypothetical protein MA16_Dca008522 [Dendrobium catenatum]